MASFSPPYTDEVPPLLPETRGVTRWLMRHYGLNPRGRNVFYLADGTVKPLASEPPWAGPDGVDVTWDDVETVWWGGHGPVEVSAAERTALEAAGYTVTDSDAEGFAGGYGGGY